MLYANLRVAAAEYIPSDQPHLKAASRSPVTDLGFPREGSAKP